MSERPLLIPESIARELMAHARAELPNEACGLLSGDLAAGRATTFHPARNVKASPYVYEVHPEDLVRIVIGIEDGDENLVAVFHSHTRTAALPSASDIRDATYPVVHLLASMTDPDADPASALRAWRLARGGATETPIRIT